MTGSLIAAQLAQKRFENIFLKGPCKVRNETETKQIETKRNKSKQNETDRNVTIQIEAKRNKIKTKRIVWNAKFTFIHSIN